MKIDLTGKSALICGSSKGIGRATALCMAEAGASVTLLSRSEDKLKAVLTELSTEHGQIHHYLALDVAHTEELGREVKRHAEEQGPFHILVNNSGGPPGGKAIDAGIDEYQEAFNSHLLANQVITTTLVPGMRSAGYGRIINIISTSVKQPIPGLGVSNTVRGAVANWSKTLANELGPDGITVNNILPGFTNTERLENIFQRKAAESGRSVDEVAKDTAASVPLKRLGEPEELARTATFIASPLASYINGINVPVDGGRTGSL